MKNPVGLLFGVLILPVAIGAAVFFVLSPDTFSRSEETRQTERRLDHCKYFKLFAKSIDAEKCALVKSNFLAAAELAAHAAASKAAETIRSASKNLKRSSQTMNLNAFSAASHSFHPDEFLFPFMNEPAKVMEFDRVYMDVSDLSVSSQNLSSQDGLTNRIEYSLGYHDDEREWQSLPKPMGPWVGFLRDLELSCPIRPTQFGGCKARLYFNVTDGAIGSELVVSFMLLDLVDFEQMKVHYQNLYESRWEK